MKLDKIHQSIVLALRDYLRHHADFIEPKTFDRIVAENGGAPLEIARYLEHLGLIEERYWDNFPSKTYFAILGKVVECGQQIEDGLNANDSESQQFKTLIEKMQLAMLDGDVGPKVLKVADDDSLSSDEKMRQLSEIDSRFVGFTSPQWANLLGVSANAIRQTETWKQWQKRGKDG